MISIVMSITLIKFGNSLQEAHNKAQNINISQLAQNNKTLFYSSVDNITSLANETTKVLLYSNETVGTIANNNKTKLIPHNTKSILSIKVNRKSTKSTTNNLQITKAAVLTYNDETILTDNKTAPVILRTNLRFRKNMDNLMMMNQTYFNKMTQSTKQRRYLNFVTQNSHDNWINWIFSTFLNVTRIITEEIIPKPSNNTNRANVYAKKITDSIKQVFNNTKRTVVTQWKTRMNNLAYKYFTELKKNVKESQIAAKNIIKTKVFINLIDKSNVELYKTLSSITNHKDRFGLIQCREAAADDGPTTFFGKLGYFFNGLVQCDFNGIVKEFSKGFCDYVKTTSHAFIFGEITNGYLVKFVKKFKLWEMDDMYDGYALVSDLIRKRGKSDLFETTNEAFKKRIKSFVNILDNLEAEEVIDNYLKELDKTNSVMEHWILYQNGSNYVNEGTKFAKMLTSLFKSLKGDIRELLKTEMAVVINCCQPANDDTAQDK